MEMYETLYEDDDYKVERLQTETGGPLMRWWVKENETLREPTPHEFRKTIRRMAKMATEYRLIHGVLDD